jgi:hypothetical protein
MIGTEKGVGQDDRDRVRPISRVWPTIKSALRWLDDDRRGPVAQNAGRSRSRHRSWTSRRVVIPRSRCSTFRHPAHLLSLFGPCLLVLGRLRRWTLNASVSKRVPPAQQQRRPNVLQFAGHCHRRCRAPACPPRSPPGRSVQWDSWIFSLVDGEPACRRDSVQPPKRPGWPSIYAVHLGTAPLTRGGRAARVPRSTLLRVGFTEPVRSPGPLVRSYRTVSPLPVRTGARHRRSVLCGTVLRVAPTGC